ncbi:hypothetical protein [Nitrosomonas supralitoralis]|uniref:Uncharacterized protein n=1 Tax=Nitrosomonas supralitoralis TaxID=2116706 RepID=A0A2P7NT04_9PROT|nr:hypothetical protein [Nitrosomonas supralitoralis]PSJ16590.1 hypothetical protein C7H79_12595 [Nitrosomonas supralitoralis]
MKLSKLKEIFDISKRLSFAFVFVVAMMGFNMQSAQAALAGKGLIHPINHFPAWFSDTNGIALQLCLDGDGVTGLCAFDPVDPANQTSVATGFGAEAFWWLGSATLNLAGGGRGILVLALEAAYGAGDPAPNDQFAFGRVRLRIDIPVAGEYKVWHPFLNEVDGCQPEVFNATAGTRAINVTRDTGGAAPFETMLNGEVGPFLVWDPAFAPTPPAGYVGDPNVDHEVIGGHCNINYFRIEGPEGVDLDGSGQNFVQTSLFSIAGKLYDEANTPPGIEPVRTTYFRRTNNNNITTGRINSWVKAPVTATVRISGLPQANGAMAFDDINTFFKRAWLNSTNALNVPDHATITATSVNGLETMQDVQVVDDVRISQATWNKGTGAIKVVAFSSDKVNAATTGAVAPVLTLHIGSDSFTMSQVGVPGRYEMLLSDSSAYLIPPARVTVTSSKGGSDTERLAD